MRSGRFWRGSRRSQRPSPPAPPGLFDQGLSREERLIAEAEGRGYEQGRLDSEMDNMSETLIEHGDKISGMDSRVRDLENQNARLSARVTFLQWQIGILASISIGGIIAIAGWLIFTILSRPA